MLVPGYHANVWASLTLIKSSAERRKKRRKDGHMTNGQASYWRCKAATEGLQRKVKEVRSAGLMCVKVELRHFGTMFRIHSTV